MTNQWEQYSDEDFFRAALADDSIIISALAKKMEQSGEMIGHFKKYGLEADEIKSYIHLGVMAWVEHIQRKQQFDFTNSKAISRFVMASAKNIQAGDYEEDKRYRQIFQAEIDGQANKPIPSDEQEKEWLKDQIARMRKCMEKLNPEHIEFFEKQEAYDWMIEELVELSKERHPEKGKGIKTMKSMKQSMYRVREDLRDCMGVQKNNKKDGKE